jgi:hypothetical protein
MRPWRLACLGLVVLASATAGAAPQPAPPPDPSAPPPAPAPAPVPEAPPAPEPVTERQPQTLLDPATAACLDAFAEAQRLRRKGQLLASRDQLVRCSLPACPALLANRCVPWLDEVNAAVPSILLAARDPAGDDTVAVRVLVDGSVIRQRLDGRPIQIDPGMHRLRFELEGADPIERSIALVEGEKGRRLDLRFQAPPIEMDLLEPEPAPEPGYTPSPLVWVGFGVGAAGFVVGTVTGALSLAKAADLRDACPDDTCDESLRDDHDEGLALAHAATASFAVGAAGAVLGVVALLFLGEPPLVGGPASRGPGFLVARF